MFEFCFYIEVAFWETQYYYMSNGELFWEKDQLFREWKFNIWRFVSFIHINHSFSTLFYPPPILRIYFIVEPPNLILLTCYKFKTIINIIMFKREEWKKNVLVEVIKTHAIFRNIFIFFSQNSQVLWTYF